MKPAGPSAARHVAFELLLAQRQPGSTLDDLLARDEVEALPARERSFLHELVLGTLRRRGSLDYALRSCLSRPLESVQPGVREVLRLGAYQVLFLRVPDRAAVSESVTLASRHFPRAKGLVNAVLRRLAREGPPAWPRAEEDALAWLTSVGSLPRWLAQCWLTHLGPQTALARAQALLEPAPTFFRLNPRVPDVRQQLCRAGVTAEPVAVPGGWRLLSGALQAPAALGLVYVQDQGSQLVARVAAECGAPLLDACAAPGGKAAAAADILGSRALIVAAELSARRRARMRGLLQRWGARHVHVVAADAGRPPFRGGFQTVLLDAPCSGLGTLARHPDLRWSATAADVTRQARRQATLLRALAGQVAPGGRLVYATCSSEPEENEQVIEAFRNSHPDYVPAPAPTWAGTFRSGPYLRTCPEVHGGDAFFASVLQRRRV